VVFRRGALSPASIYQGFVAQRDELGGQLEKLQETRNSLSEKVTDPMVRGLDRTGLESRITALDARIAQVDKAIAQADASVASAAATPGAMALRDQERANNQSHDGPPEAPFFIGGLFIVAVLLPISLAFARRIWRRGTAAVANLPDELLERMSRLEQAVESIAIEVERIGEGQRFMTRVFTDANGRALGAGPAEPVRVPPRDAVAARLPDDAR
jgi:hypothetical protein